MYGAVLELTTKHRGATCGGLNIKAAVDKFYFIPEIIVLNVLGQSKKADYKKFKYNIAFLVSKPIVVLQLLD